MAPGEWRATQRGRLVAAWLQAMEPMLAPPAMAGRVVAAMNPGQRQDRAAGAVSALTRFKAPHGLDRLVAANILGTDPQTRQVAPAELDDLVEGRVAEPEATLVRGMAMRLEPVQAPSELELRVERQLSGARGAAGPSTGQAGGAARPSERSTGSLRATLAAFALAAGILISTWIADPISSSQADRSGSEDSGTSVVSVEPVVSGQVVSAASGLSFRVIRVTAENISAADRAALGAVGLLAVGES